MDTSASIASGVSAFVATLLLVCPAHAVDTIETFDLGASDLELYAGYDGFGRPDEERVIFSDMVLGYGLTPGFSAVLGATVSGGATLGNGATAVHLGAFGTPVSTHHFNLDLGIDFTQEAETLDITPYVELNFDLEPDLALAGLYLREELCYGQADNALGEPELAVLANSALGAYVTPAEGHQLLTEVATTWSPSRLEGSSTFTVDGLALGYNLMLTDAVELLCEVGADIPQAGDSWAYALSLGFIATLPGASEE